jgi:hypothetical protein
MKLPRPKPFPTPHQLSMALDTIKLRGMSPTERGRVLALLARLLLEAAGATKAGEQADDRV